MKKDTDHAYDINKLNMFFALSSIVMFAFFAWMLWQDFNRDWKRVQAQFRRLEKARTASLIQKEETSLQGNAEYTKVSQDLDAAKAEQKQQKAEYDKALKDQKDIQGVWYKADQAFRFKKAEYEANRYDYEEAVAEHPKSASDKKEKLDKSFNAMQDLTHKLDEVNAKKSAIEANVEKYTKRIDDLEKEKTKLQTKLDRMERKEANFSASPANIFRNLPLVDFIGPSIKIQQVVVDNIYEDINFTRIPRVDRCMTCHASIDQDGYKEGDDIPNYGKITQPFVSHPKLDIFVGATSKHPMDRFGCTSCTISHHRRFSRNKFLYCGASCHGVVQPRYDCRCIRSCAQIFRKTSRVCCQFDSDILRPGVYDFTSSTPGFRAGILRFIGALVFSADAG